MLRYEVLADPVVRPEPHRSGAGHLAPAGGRVRPVPRRPAGAPVTLPGGGPRIVLCVAGTARLDAVTLRSGEAAFVPAADPPVEVTGDTTVFQAATAA